MSRWCLAVLALLLLGCATQPGLDRQGQRHHAYAFDKPELLATQRAFGVGNAITLLGVACANDDVASASYAQWTSANQTVLAEMTAVLAAHYRIPATSADLQKRVAESMHLKTQLDLSDAALTKACVSLPETLALPSMNLGARYQAVLKEVSRPDYLKPQRTPREERADQGAPEASPEIDDKPDEPEEQTRSE